MTQTETLIKHLKAYHPLSEESIAAFTEICKEESYQKGELLQRAGAPARNIYFIVRGLVGYYSIDEQGNTIYKTFFAENSFVASTAALISGEASAFAIVALEDCEVVAYPAAAYRALYQAHHDLALFHINYLERNWVVKKEPLEIALKHETAKARYLKLSTDMPIYKRLKQHHIASYLGVTPTQLSRIRKELKK